MNYLKQVQRGIDFIEANLDFDVALDEVARQAGISQWHFQRIFKALTNETLKTYIRSRRLAKSLDRLLSTDARIIDIAQNAGFDTQEGFTRAFKKAFRLTPDEYRRLGKKHRFLKKVEFDSDYLRHINQNISLVPELTTHATRQFVGIRTEFYGIDSDKNNIGKHLPPLWAAFLPRLGEIENAIAGVCYGVVRQTQAKTDLLEYHAAIEVIGAPGVPDGMEYVEIPGATYATFAHRGEAKHIDRTVNYIYSTWLAQSGKRHTYGADLEVYDSGYDAASPESIMYYSIPVAAA